MLILPGVIRIRNPTSSVIQSGVWRDESAVYYF